MGLLCAATVALIPPFIDRLRSFSSEFSLWDDAVRKNSDATAPLVERSYRNRGVALYKFEKYEAALADFDRAAALDPRSVQAWMTRGTLFMRTGQTDKALSDFDRTLQIDARDADTLGRRCIVLLRLRRYEDAPQDCRSARDLNPYDPLNHGILLNGVSRTGEARRGSTSSLPAAWAIAGRATPCRGGAAP
jgi:Flp pilus assembly protein TadD